MSSAMVQGNGTDEAALQRDILTLGRKIFSSIGNSSPSLFRKNFWSSKLMSWSMSQPALKTDLFRLVDVLPTLRSSQSVTRHMVEYLEPHLSELPGLPRWALMPKPGSPRGLIAAWAVRRGVTEMAKQFIAGEGPQDALSALHGLRKRGLAFTVDLLGEYTLSESEAQTYLSRYEEALTVLGKAAPLWREAAALVPGHPGDETPICISVKLTALYSQCSALNFDRSVAVLSERLTKLARLAKKVNARIYIDAEDTGNNPIIYRAFEQVFGSSEFIDYPYPGIVIQAYCINARATVEHMLQFARKRGSPIAIRLVKGAYWDSETINAKVNDWPSPLLRHKESSDAQFESLSRLLLDNHAVCMPAFGSHNVRSLSHACCYAQKLGLKPTDFELQMLYGMAEPIAQSFRQQGYLVRMYVPLGDLFVGMGYLVRRLLENTSNESFLKHTFFDHANIEHLLRQPHFQD